MSRSVMTQDILTMYKPKACDIIRLKTYSYSIQYYFQIMNTVYSCSRLLRSQIYRNSCFLSTTSILPKVTFPNSQLARSPLHNPKSVTQIVRRGIQYDFDSKNQEKKEEEETEFDEVASKLALDLTNVFLKKITIDLYHPDMELDDRIRGQKYKGLIFYIKSVHLLKILAHIKFVYVRPQIVKMTKLHEERKIVVDWKFVGLTQLRMALRYIPDKLWNRANMDHAAKTWYEGVSTFYLDEDNKIVKIHIEKSEAGNKNQTLQQMRDSVRQKNKI